jgi:protein O-mannosyl-transferase
MALTSYQKNYIKKKLGKLDIKTISQDLKLEEKIVIKFLKKRLSEEKFRKIIGKERKQEASEGLNVLQDLNSFTFGKFFLVNISYFVLFFLMILVTYYSSLGNAFVSDDINALLKNPEIGNFGYAFAISPSMIQKIFHYISFHLGGLTPAYYRIFNILLHTGSTFIVFTLLSLFTKRNVAIFATSIFAVHPIFTESITWVSGMPYPLYSFFLLASFLTYILSRSRKNLLYLSLVFFVCALISSQKAIVFFPILVLYELSTGTLKYNWKRLSPYFLMNFVLIINYAGQISSRISSIEAVSYEQSSGMYNPFYQIPIAIGSYLKLMLWPDKLSLYQTELNFSVIQYLTFLILFLVFLGIIFYSWKKNRSVFFWLSFFIIALSPDLTPFKISWVVAERYVYLGSIGAIVGFAMLFDWLSQKTGDKYKYVFFGFLTLFVIALSIRTMIRNIDWKNEDNLWIATLKVSPSGPNIHNNMGDVYARNNDFEKAAEEFIKATEINPNYADAYHNLANTYKSIGKNDLAVENYQKALKINPNIWQSYQNLAAVYYEQGNMQKAKEYMDRAVKLNPTDPGLQQNLSLIENSLKK